jgi:hypothetical protein
MKLNDTLRHVVIAAAVLLAATEVNAQDPRIGLKAGWKDAAVTAKGVELVANLPRPEGFFNAANLGDILVINSDMAFQGSNLFLGNFTGFQIYDISNPAAPKLRTAFMCPGGQGDVSVYGNLLFMSVEMPNGRVDCSQGTFQDSVSANRFLGVRIFDISHIEQPKQVAAVQTCRGSHTHTLVTDPKDKENVYIYVQGTSGVRSPTELAGCSGAPPERDPNTARFRIEIIKVPLAAPQNAAIVNAPRIFANPQTGEIAGLWKGGRHGAGTQETATTDQCHDITVYPEFGLAAGACSGNGILLDITDVTNPVRIAEVMDPNFAYWHSATFNNDATKVLYTDEWGGGMAPRCQATDKPNWGANALFDLTVDRKLEHASYYKLPVAQTANENCVAHNGNLIPVPGRDIMAQAWYQGGMSIVDFTDTAKPFEIAYFDRGPLADKLHLGGLFSTYWYNGHIYGSEMGRGLDVYKLVPGEHLTQNEIDAANTVRFEALNPQTQTRLKWPPSFVVARAYIDQLKRSKEVPVARLTEISTRLARAEKLTGAAKSKALKDLSATVSGLNSTTRSAALLTQVLVDLAQ